MQQPVCPRREDDAHHADEDDAAEQRMIAANSFPPEVSILSTGPMPPRIIDAFSNESSHPRPSVGVVADGARDIGRCHNQDADQKMTLDANE